MAVRLSCLVLTLIVANFGKGEDTPSTIGQVLKIPSISGGPTVKETEKSTITPIEHLEHEVEPNNADLKESGINDKLGGNDGFKRLARNAGFFRRESMYPRYPLPYRGLGGFGQRQGFGRGQWNQGGFGRIGPVNPIRPGIGPVSQNPGGFWNVPQRPINNPMPFGGPRYPQGSFPGAFGRHNDFSGQGNQNGKRDDPEQDDFNINVSFPDWDQIPVGFILADVNENEQGTISAQIAMVFVPELSDDEPYLPQK